jgi:ATP-binding cassette subfamily C (CFTR/MRP) protein 5
MCITAFLTVVLHGQVPPALAGLALAYAAHISGIFQYTTRLVSETQVRFISVERINSYIRVRYIVSCIILASIMPIISLLTLNSVAVK